jgi:superfamily I DNA/RNA helicase
MEFNEDGSLKVSKKDNKDHIKVFNLIDELDFSVGKKLLIQILRGETNLKIKKHNLESKIYHGCLAKYDENELSLFIDCLIQNDFLKIKLEKGLYKTIILTKDGKNEIENQEFSYKVEGIQKEQKIREIPKTQITEQDEILFKELDFLLNNFTREQKKAIIDLTSKQLCIAGAGSGKTLVLTYKIYYLINFLGVKPEDILAITFTRKARAEMLTRLSKMLGEKQVRIETFNSFAEKEISYHSLILYGKDKSMIQSKDFTKIVLNSLKELGYSPEKFLENYFTKREQQKKDFRQLFFSFLYDFSAIYDTYIRHGKNIEEFRKKIKLCKDQDRMIAATIIDLLEIVSQKLEENSLRTYADQLRDLLKLYNENPTLRKKYEWVLVDEYQDVNEEQIHLLELFSPKNIFVVGDPRQSIFSWRGSIPEQIYDFIDEKTQVIQLTTNFRSSEDIVSFSNEIVKEMGLEDCKSNGKELGQVILTKYPTEDIETLSIIEEIKRMQVPRKEIFVLSRTNKGLEKIKAECDKNEIKYIMRTDEKKQLNLEPSEDEITLSTVHAIKGLEAKIVYVISANYMNYPCRAKDHRFVELFSQEKNYDQIQEEKRLLYVACTRAKNLLRITYTSTLSSFITETMLKKINHKKQDIELKIDETNYIKQENALKKWRYLEAKDRNMNAFNIFSDKVLEQLIDKQPKSVDELYEISGLNKQKIQEFGYDIITILRKNS